MWLLSIVRGLCTLISWERPLHGELLASMGSLSIFQKGGSIDYYYYLLHITYYILLPSLSDTRYTGLSDTRYTGLSDTRYTGLSDTRYLTLGILVYLTLGI